MKFDRFLIIYLHSIFSGLKKSQCHQNQFQCSTGECVNMDFHCNHQIECMDGSDELNCGTFVSMINFTTLCFIKYVLRHSSCFIYSITNWNINRNLEMQRKSIFMLVWRFLRGFIAKMRRYKKLQWWFRRNRLSWRLLLYFTIKTRCMVNFWRYDDNTLFWNIYTNRWFLNRNFFPMPTWWISM